MSAVPAPTRRKGGDVVSRAELRRRLADAAERIIAALDALDGDADAEPDADSEPSLGWTKTMAWGTTDDRECPDAEDHL